MSRHTKWANHIDEGLSNANKYLGGICNSFKNIVPMTFKKLYSALVRPHVDSAASVWKPYFQKEIDLI